MGVYTSAVTKHIAVASNTTKTLLQLHNDNVGTAKIVEWGISFDGISSTATPARVKLIRQTTGGTMTQRGAGVKYDSSRTDSNASYRVKATAEPTLTADIYELHQVTPTGGLLVKQYPLGREITLNAGERLGLVVTAGPNSAASALGYIVWEE